jgi:GNAT superfamily N-acetyltransferase
MALNKSRGLLSISIRRALANDAPRLSDLARGAKAHWGYPAEWLAAWQLQLTIEPQYITEHRVLVAETSGALAGMCALEDRGQWWSLEHVWVDPDHMGQGIGRTLVEAALTIARESRPGRVLTEADPNAAGFYRKLGARQVGVVPASMPGAADRVLPVFEFQPVTV